MRNRYNDAATQVAKTACQLDVIRPNWFKQIDTKYLDLTNGIDCVLGQTGGYERGKIRLYHEFGGRRVIDQVFYYNDEYRQHWINEIELRRDAVVKGEQEEERLRRLREAPYAAIPLWADTHQPPTTPVKTPVKLHILAA